MDTCPDCGSSFYHDGRCIVCATAGAMARMREQHRQMKERSGPQYELAAGRSRVGSAAYRAGGSPPKVRSVTVGSIDADGQWHGELKYYLARSMRRAGRITSPNEWVEATPEQVADWEAWQRQKLTTSR